MLISNDFITKPYVLYFTTRLKLKQEIAGNIPTWCRYPMPAAQEVIHYCFSRTDILTQHFNQAPFYVDILQINTETPFQFKFQVNDNQLFLLFMLNGSFEFSTIDGRYITKAKTNYFYLSHNGPGMFKASMKSGNHVALVVAIEIDWAKRVCHELTNLNTTLEDILASAKLYNIMPHCRMDRQVHLWLEGIHSLSKTNIGVLDGMLRLYMSLTLEHYNKLLSEREAMLAFKIKKYLDEHYVDTELEYPSLAALFYVTERTLRNQFRSEFHETIHCYYTRLRLERARYLIEMLHEPTKDVYFKVGYKDESSFRHAYSKYTGKNPR